MRDYRSTDRRTSERAAQVRCRPGVGECRAVWACMVALLPTRGPTLHHQQHQATQHIPGIQGRVLTHSIARPHP